MLPVICLFFTILSLQTETVPTAALEWFRKGEELIGTDRQNSEEQAEYFEKALQAAPDFNAARYNLILVYWHQENLDKALEHCNELIRYSPDDVRGFRLRSRILQKLDQPEKALTDLEKGVELDPGNYEIWEDLAGFYFRKGAYEQSIRAYRKILELHPSPVEAYFNMALAQHRSGQTEDAISSYRKYLASNPGDFEAHFLLGTAYRSRGEKEKAIEEWIKAEKIRQDDPRLHQVLGDLLLEIGRTEEARLRLSRAGTDQARNLANLGIVAKQEGRPSEALSYLRRAVSLEPDRALIWGHLGDVFADLGRTEEAAGAYRKAIELDPQDFNSLLNLGTLLANQEKPDEAENFLRRAVDIESSSADAHYALAGVLDRLGQNEDCLLYTSPSPRDLSTSRMPSSA